MTLKYCKSFLSDGTKVKITKELKLKIEQWEKAGYEIEDRYLDLLKKHDNEEINNLRNYYIHNTSLEDQIKSNYYEALILRDEDTEVEDLILKNERYTVLVKILNGCTEKQRRRFIKNYFLNYTLSQIAKQEDCSVAAVHYSVKAVEEKLIFYEQ